MAKTQKMKKYIFIFLAILTISTGFTFIGTNEVQEPTILEKVARAHGFDNWQHVTALKFTFNVDRDTSHFERSWIWNPKTNDITAIKSEGNLKYNWANMDSIANKTNSSFINDKYWFLVPFQLMWDAKNITYKLAAKAEAPISKKSMQKLTIVYGNEGGYTPGDAYDLYFGDDYILREWVYRKGNQAAASVVTTWEGYIDVGGLKIGTVHKNAEGNFKLSFTNVKVDKN